MKYSPVKGMMSTCTLGIEVWLFLDLVFTDSWARSGFGLPVYFGQVLLECSHTLWLTYCPGLCSPAERRSYKKHRPQILDIWPFWEKKKKVYWPWSRINRGLATFRQVFSSYLQQWFSVLTINSFNSWHLRNNLGIVVNIVLQVIYAFCCFPSISG